MFARLRVCKSFRHRLVDLRSGWIVTRVHELFPGMLAGTIL